MPTGRTIAQIVGRFMSRQQADVIAWLRAGGRNSLPDLNRHIDEMAEALLPAYQRIYQLGGQDAARRITQQARRPGHRRGKGYSGSRWVVK